MGNLRNIGFNTTVYDRDSVDNVLDRSFKEFAQTASADTRSLSQFFKDYEHFYYQMPISGATGSHQYLVEKSSELYKTSSLSEDIQPLLDEITLLRSQSVADQQTIIDLRLELGELSATNNTTLTVEDATA